MDKISSKDMLVVMGDWNAKFGQTNMMWTMCQRSIEGDQFKVNMGEKKSISCIDIEMYLTLLGNI